MEKNRRSSPILLQIEERPEEYLERILRRIVVLMKTCDLMKVEMYRLTVRHTEG